MKEETRVHLGLLLAGLGVLYLIWFVPGLPAWLWALLGAALFFALARLRGVAAAAGYGALFLGWGLGALAADLAGLQSLKLVGGGLGLFLWGRLEAVEWAAWAGTALALAGLLVFVWEASLGGWLALALLAAGLYLALREPPAPPAAEAADDGFLAGLLGWRNEEARRRGVLNTTVLSDEEVGCLAALPRPPDPAAVAACLGGDEERARRVMALLEGAKER